MKQDEKKQISYSKAVMIPLSRLCRNKCQFCGFTGEDKLTVPYRTIKTFKEAKNKGIKEALFEIGERPDKFNEIRSILDLWGFSSYVNYVYTVCELAFLEGLIPSIEAGFFSPKELIRLKEIVVSLKIMMDCMDEKVLKSEVFSESPGKKIELVERSLIYAGKLRFPVVTGVMIGLGESNASRKKAFEYINKLQEEYGHIQEVVIQPFVPVKGTPLWKKKPPSKNDLINSVKIARDILRGDINISLPLNLIGDPLPFIKAGVNDFGRVFEGDDLIVHDHRWPNIRKIEKHLKAHGYSVEQRLPLTQKYIRDGWYSQKLGQALDNYRHKYKKDDQNLKDKKEKNIRNNRKK